MQSQKEPPAPPHAQGELPKMKDVQVMLAAVWLGIAKIAADKIEGCSFASAAKEWEQIAERATARALDHMRAGLHKKREGAAKP